MRKTLLRLLAVTIAASGLASCAFEPMTTQEATQWIAAYTPEHIDMASQIPDRGNRLPAGPAGHLASVGKVFPLLPLDSGRGRVCTGR